MLPRGRYTPLDTRFLGAAAEGGSSPPRATAAALGGVDPPGHTKGLLLPLLLLLLRPTGTFSEGLKQAPGDMAHVRSWSIYRNRDDLLHMLWLGLAKDITGQCIFDFAWGASAAAPSDGRLYGIRNGSRVWGLGLRSMDMSTDIPIDVSMDNRKLRRLSPRR